MGLAFNALSGQFDLVGGGASGSSNSFTIIQPDFGTAPTASSSTDTLTNTSADLSLTITGSSGAKSINFKTTIPQKLVASTSTVIGVGAAPGMSVGDNEINGHRAAEAVTTSTGLTIHGAYALLSLTAGDNNTVSGSGAATGNAHYTASDLTAYGANAADQLTGNNAANGLSAFGSKSAFLYNKYVNCTYMGFNSDSAGTGQTNSSGFGYGAVCPRDNFIQFGNGSLVGIGWTGYAEMTEIATPATPASGFNRLYFKSDHKLYRLDSTGAEVLIG